MADDYEMYSEIDSTMSNFNTHSPYRRLALPDSERTTQLADLVCNSTLPVCIRLTKKFGDPENQNKFKKGDVLMLHMVYAKPVVLAVDVKSGKTLCLPLFAAQKYEFLPKDPLLDDKEYHSTAELIEAAPLPDVVRVVDAHSSGHPEEAQEVDDVIDVIRVDDDIERGKLLVGTVDGSKVRLSKTMTMSTYTTMVSQEYYQMAKLVTRRFPQRVRIPDLSKGEHLRSRKKEQVLRLTGVIQQKCVLATRAEGDPKVCCLPLATPIFLECIPVAKVKNPLSMVSPLYQTINTTWGVVDPTQEELPPSMRAIPQPIESVLRVWLASGEGKKRTETAIGKHYTDMNKKVTEMAAEINKLNNDILGYKLLLDKPHLKMGFPDSRTAEGKKTGPSTPRPPPPPPNSDPGPRPRLDTPPAPPVPRRKEGSNLEQVSPGRIDKSDFEKAAAAADDDDDDEAEYNYVIESNQPTHEQVIFIADPLDEDEYSSITDVASPESSQTESVIIYKHPSKVDPKTLTKSPPYYVKLRSTAEPRDKTSSEQSKKNQSLVGESITETSHQIFHEGFSPSSNSKETPSMVFAKELATTLGSKSKAPAGLRRHLSEPSQAAHKASMERGRPNTDHSSTAQPSAPPVPRKPSIQAIGRKAPPDPPPRTSRPLSDSFRLPRPTADARDNAKVTPPSPHHPHLSQLPRSKSENLSPHVHTRSTCEEVGAFLRGCKLGQYANKFVDNEVSGELLLALSEKIMTEELGMRKLDALKLSLAIGKSKKE